MAAGRMVERIQNTVDQLSDFPYLGRTGRIPGTRELVVAGSPFIVPYRIREDVIEILTVFHAARRWPEEL